MRIMTHLKNHVGQNLTPHGNVINNNNQPFIYQVEKAVYNNRIN